MTETYEEARDRLMKGSYEVNIWRYYLLPMWHCLRYTFKTNEWLLQLTETIETKEDGKPVKRERHYYLKRVGDGKA